MKGIALILLATFVLLAPPVVLASPAILDALPSFGGGTSTKVLQPTNPRYSDLYVSIKAPPPLVHDIARWALRGSSGFVVAPNAQGARVCSYQGTVTDGGVSDDVAITLSGSNPRIPSMCRALFLSAFPVG
jgi:hypothetical protein